MSILRDILVEERERLQDLIKMYDLEIEKLPKGSFSVKRIRHGIYAYRAFREAQKVKFEYLGEIESSRAVEFKDKMESRRKFLSLLKQSNKNLKEVERMLRVSKA